MRLIAPLVLLSLLLAPWAGSLAAEPAADATQADHGLQPAAASAALPPTDRLRIKGDRFVDTAGRQVLLHGLNVVGKSKSEGYQTWHRAEDFAAMRAWGMNCIRLGIIWDGVEPQPSKYDEAYLDRVAERVAWAAEAGQYVILDMHQDLYSALYSDGAPAWATLDEGQPHVTGAVWSDSYMVSPAVQRAFDNFWANKPGPDGMGVQERYAAAWRHVARRFADNPAIIGYDLMNEPFEGSSAQRGQEALMHSPFARELAKRLGKEGRPPEEIAALWLDPAGRAAITRELEDLELYEAFLAAQEETSQRFERERLQPMYQRVASAIREVDARHALLIEPSYRCNAGVASGLKPLVGAGGQRDSQQAFAPHGYDIVVDTASLAQANPGRVDLIFRRLHATGQRLQAPMLVGEWGAFGNADGQILPSARLYQRKLEELLCGDVYWDYGRAIERTASFSVLKRSIPSRIAGRLLEYRSDPESGAFVCRWQEEHEVTAPSLVYLTADAMKNRSLRVSPPGAGYEVQAAAESSGDVYVVIPSTGDSVERTLVVE